MSKKSKKSKKKIYSEPTSTFLYTCDGTCRRDWVTPYEAEHMGWDFQFVPAVGMIVRCSRCKCMDNYALRFCASLFGYVLEATGEYKFREAIDLQMAGHNIYIDGTKIQKSYQKVFLLDKHHIKVDDREFVVEGLKTKFLKERFCDEDSSS